MLFRSAASGINYTILRANSFHQNIGGQLNGIKADGAFYLPLGDAHQSLIDVEDIAAAAIVAMTTDAHRNQRYDITGPESLTFHDVAKLAELLKSPATISICGKSTPTALAGLRTSPRVGMPAALN